jgi:Co/Zn/Cd efflux system component
LLTHDAIGNVVVMVAALGVWGTSTAWPDLAVAALMAAVFCSSSVQILRQAWSEYRQRYSVPAEQKHKMLTAYKGTLSGTVGYHPSG